MPHLEGIAEQHIHPRVLLSYGILLWFSMQVTIVQEKFNYLLDTCGRWDRASSSFLWSSMLKVDARKTVHFSGFMNFCVLSSTKERGADSVPITSPFLIAALIPRLNLSESPGTLCSLMQ